MKYMTPDLIVRGQSRDPAELDAVEAAWEEQGERYRDYLAAIRPELPPGLLRFLDRDALHDARVVGMFQSPGAFTILVQPEGTGELLNLRYDLVADPVIVKGVLPADIASQGDWVEWWYDEVDRLAGKVPTWRLSILLSNGWEITLDCRDVHIEEGMPILPTAATLGAHRATTVG